MDQGVALLFSMEELVAQTKVEFAFGPEEMNRAVGSGIEIAESYAAAGLIVVHNFDPLVKAAFGDVGIPGVIQPPERIVPLLACEVLFEGAAFKIRFENVACAAEIDRAIFDCNVWIANADGLLVFYWPTKLAVGGPISFSIEKAPFGMSIINVLEEDQFVSVAIGGETAVGVFSEPRCSFPGRSQSDESRPVLFFEFEQFRKRRTAVGLAIRD